MTLSQAIPDPSSRQETSSRHSAASRAQAFAAFSDPFDPPSSQRQYARSHGLPASTLSRWLRDTPEDLPPAVVDFFCCPDGLLVLRRIVVAAFLVFQQSGGSGIRSVAEFFRLTQLDRFVASSYGALHSLAGSIEQFLADFEAQQRPQLAAAMPARQIAVCTDENFHGRKTCLVAVEPESNFLLLESYAQQRDAATWTQALTQATSDLPVEVVLMCSDRASGLLSCAESGLRVGHSSDLFHLQRDVLKPLLLPLVRPIRQASQDLHQATVDIRHAEQLACASPPPKPRRGRQVDPFDKLVKAVRQQQAAQTRLQQSQEQLEQVLQPIRAMSDDYHPFDRQTGKAVNATQLRVRLEGHLEKLREQLLAAGLTEKLEQVVKEATEMITLLVAYLGWFWTKTQQQMEKLRDTTGLTEQHWEELVAGYYWEAAARRARTAEERRRLSELARRLQQKGQKEGGGPREEPEEEELRQQARRAASLFVRSSSCVEGRNGRLSLQHHGRGGLSSKRLKALGVIHNYVSRRADGTTAAERFFGQKHSDVFSWILERLPDLPRPAEKRTSQPAAVVA